MDRPEDDAPTVGDNDIERTLANWRRIDEQWGASAHGRQSAPGVVQHFPGGTQSLNHDAAEQLRASVTWKVGAAVLAPLRVARRVLGRGGPR